MILKKLIILGIIFILAGCSNKIIKDPVYTKNNITYRITDNKPVNGIISREYGDTIKYFTYRKGKLVNYKNTSDPEGRIIEERNYDSMGLLHGKLTSFRGFAEYSHGILNGESNRDAANIYFDSPSISFYKDGVLHGRQEINGKIKYFDEGMISKEEPKMTPPPIKNISWGEAPKENYTGDLYSAPTTAYEELVPFNSNSALEVKGYEKGDLKYIKYYTKSGEKIKEYHLYNKEGEPDTKVSKYEHGKLISRFTYNSDGQLIERILQ